MIYAKVHIYTDLSGKEVATVTSSESIAEGTEGEWVAFDVPLWYPFCNRQRGYTRVPN